ncbi:general secretion pathway protein L [Simiduia aestuariiviva]|uniref:Type II secretion system protein L n=2 Tax=Simiduia aestuariiviva TaxID=1510459 RepID=A0A839UPQ9_9GAMM|nr:general secretion pathway protein L [Simiduia aestuariiviva]
MISDNAMTTDALPQPAINDSELSATSSALEGLYLYPQPLGEATPDTPAEPRYRWRRLSAGQWTEMQTGDVNALCDALPQWPAQAIMVVPAEAVVTRSLLVAPGERRYFKKLAPFQLEEDIIDDVTDLHFVYGPLGDEGVDLAYCRTDLLNQWLAPFFERELPVSYVISAASLLPDSAGDEWVLMLDDQRCYYRLSTTRFGAVQPALVPMFLASLANDHKPARIQLLATGDALLTQLADALPPSLAQASLFKRLVTEPLAASASAPNLAVEQFSPRIPLSRWLGLIKLPAVLLLAGLCVHLTVALTEWQIATNHTQALKAAITERYRAAVPSGAISDPLKQLRNQVNRLGSGAQGSNALSVLSRAVPVLTARSGVEVKNLQFSNDAQELRLTIQAPALADIEALSSQFKAQGFGAEVLSVNVNNGVHQARMKVTRK